MNKLPLIVISLFAFAASGSAGETRKNVLLLMADDFNYWTGTDGYYPAARTPNLDRLARKGVFFSNAHSASPVCHPSRNAMWSGVSPMASGIDANGQPFIREVPGFEDVVTLNQYFKENGYHVYGAGKLWHPGVMNPSNPHIDPEHWSELNSAPSGAQGGSLNRFKSSVQKNVAWSANPEKLSEDNTADYALAKDVVRFLENRSNSGASDQPFFVACGFFRPHLPFHSPKEFWDRFDASELQRPAGADLEKDWDIAMASFKEIYEEGVWEQGIHAYLAACALADYNVGVVLDALEASPYHDNTIVLFMGDHGWQLGEKGRWGKYATWEAANKTTFIVYDPKAPGNGGICSQPVTLQDVYPTLVELTGLPYKRDIDGRSLTALLEKPTREDWREPIVMQYSGTRYIRSDKWRFVERGAESELYDMENDPYEGENLYGQKPYREVVASLRQQIDAEVQGSQAIHSGNRINEKVETKAAVRLPF